MLDGAANTTKSGCGGAYSQPIAVILTSVILRVGQMHKICPGFGQPDAQIRIGVVRQQSYIHVRVIVVVSQHLSIRVGQPQQRIERRIQPAGGHLGNHLIALVAVQPEYVNVARLDNAPVDYRGRSMR